MQLFLDQRALEASIGPGLLEVRTAIELGAAGARLRIVTPLGERVVAVSLELHRRDKAPALAPNINLAVEGDNRNKASWVTADWGGPLLVRSFTLSFTSTSELDLRVRIARGTSAWYSPPGRHSFQLPAQPRQGNFKGSLADVVADRLMLEFFARNTSTPLEVQLADPPIALEFNPHAGHPRLSLFRGRELFSYAGAPTAEQAITTGDLIESLRGQVPLEESELELELTAGIGGHLELVWRVGFERVIRELPVARCQLGELECRDIELCVAPDKTRLRLRSFALRSTVELAHERLRLRPGASNPYTRALAELARPLYDNAQAFRLDPPESPPESRRPLARADLWLTRLNDEPVDARLLLQADVNGLPSGVTLAEVGTALTGEFPSAADGRGAFEGWQRFEFDEPVVLPTGRFWLILMVDRGELAWALAPREKLEEVLEPRYRRNEGEWLPREGKASNHWALTRLWLYEPNPAPLRVSLCFDGSTSPIELTPDEQGLLRWEADDAPPVRRVDLRLQASAPASVQLSELELCVREEGGA